MYDKTIHMVNLLTIIQLAYVYGNDVHALFTSGKWVFDKGVSKPSPFTTTWFKILYGYDNYNNIDIGFSSVQRAIMFVTKYGNKNKYECRM